MAIWYPARIASLTRPSIAFGTYVDLSDGSMIDGVGGRHTEWRRRRLAESVSRDPSSVAVPLLDSLLGSRMAAVLDAPMGSERVPAILWSTRHATPAAQSVLSEYLASHGYVVAWMRYAGLDSLRPPFDNVPGSRKAETIEAHVADMQWALRRLATHPKVDSTRLGIAAWSYSGEPAAVLAQRTPRLRVLVSLSSNIFVSSYRGVDMAESIDSLPIRADILMLEETGAARGTVRQAPAILDRMPAHTYRVSFASLAHGNFNVLEGMIPGLTGISTVQPWSTGGPSAQTGYELVARAVLAVLDKRMKGAPGNADGWLADVSRLDSGTVSLVRHGPGRLASATAGTSFVDERVTIPSDAWRLIGNVVRPAAAGRVPAVLMLNKANGDRRVYTELARELARRGIASLRMDLRGEGESTTLGSFVPGLPNGALEHEERDVTAAMRWLRAHASVDPARIGVVGASYSGEAMAVAARAGAQARAYVALSPGSLSLETIDAIDPSGVPWWILRSRNERFVRDVVDSTRARSRTARVTEVAGAAHATDMLVWRPELAGEIAEWLSVVLSRR